MEHGDLRENAEYQTAKERQSYVQAQLANLQHRLSTLSMIDLTKIPTDRVSYGSTVVLFDLDSEEEIIRPRDRRPRDRPYDRPRDRPYDRTYDRPRDRPYNDGSRGRPHGWLRGYSSDSPHGCSREYPVYRLGYPSGFTTPSATTCLPVRRTDVQVASTCQHVAQPAPTSCATNEPAKGGIKK